MEINEAALEICSQGTCNNWDIDHREQVQSGKSYECNFCKKGFSNAQALGGHMNIHRKDKAKLKQASKDHHLRLMDHSLTSSSSSSSLRTTSTNSVPPRDQTQVAAELKQLPLFVDHSNPIIQAPGNSWKKLEDLQKNSNNVQGSFGAELDLELRLGQSPPDSSSLFLGTRKFF